MLGQEYNCECASTNKQPPVKIGITKTTSPVPLLASLWFALNPRGKGSVLRLPTVYCSSSLYPLILAWSLHALILSAAESIFYSFNPLAHSYNGCHSQHALSLTSGGHHSFFFYQEISLCMNVLLNRNSKEWTSGE
jgi:hypothetical protein